MSAGFRDMLRAFENFRAEVEECHEVDGERVLVLVRSMGRGKTSGLDFEQLRNDSAALFQVPTAR